MAAKASLSSLRERSTFVVTFTSNERYAGSDFSKLGRLFLKVTRNLRIINGIRSSSTEHMLAKNGKRPVERNFSLKWL